MASKRVTATYTAQERTDILRLAEQVGPVEAARRKLNACRALADLHWLIAKK